MRLPIGDVLGFATGATTPESLDSSKVRSNTIRRAQEVGLVRVTRYGKTAGYVASPELIDGLSEQARKLVALVDELHAARPLLVAATRLGIRPEDALAVLMPPTREDLDVAALAELVAAAAEDLEAAQVARERLALPSDGDVGLEEAAAALGVDLNARRDAIRNVSSTTVVTTA